MSGSPVGGATAPGDVARRYDEIRERVDGAARGAGRDPGDVLIVGASKTVDLDRIRVALDAGLRDLGENRAQELVAKAPELAGAGTDAPRWHFLGQLQRNKVRAVAPYVGLWQSVDRGELGAEIARRAPGARVLVEVNLAAEPQKAGCEPAAVPALVDLLRSDGLDVRGLMAVPPASGDPRPWFAALRSLGQELQLPELSMGMSADYEAAVSEGATIVRIGRALFGDRPPPGVATAPVARPPSVG
ncbi:MAG: pyridoxal phosphate enzyme YggS family [Actinomycetia bacterium]|nr:pyridoxal phosphate enzyme YggS family [Actinomycetes bacterium]